MGSNPSTFKQEEVCTAPKCPTPPSYMPPSPCHRRRFALSDSTDSKCSMRSLNNKFAVSYANRKTSDQAKNFRQDLDWEEQVDACQKDSRRQAAQRQETELESTYAKAKDHRWMLCALVAESHRCFPERRSQQIALIRRLMSARPLPREGDPYVRLVLFVGKKQLFGTIEEKDLFAEFEA